MARQKGIIKLKGTIGDIFTRPKTGIWPVRKGGIEESRIANDPAFQRTRGRMVLNLVSREGGEKLCELLCNVALNSADSRMVESIDPEYD
jgi:hypothetical protein